MEESGIWISPTLQSWTHYPRIVELKAKLKDENISISEEAELQDLERRAENRLDVMRCMLDYDLVIELFLEPILVLIIWLLVIWIMIFNYWLRLVLHRQKR